MNSIRRYLHLLTWTGVLCACSSTSQITPPNTATPKASPPQLLWNMEGDPLRIGGLALELSAQFEAKEKMVKMELTHGLFQKPYFFVTDDQAQHIAEAQISGSHELEWHLLRNSKTVGTGRWEYGRMETSFQAWLQASPLTDFSVLQICAFQTTNAKGPDASSALFCMPMRAKMENPHLQILGAAVAAKGSLPLPFGQTFTIDWLQKNGAHLLLRDRLQPLKIKELAWTQGHQLQVDTMDSPISDTIHSHDNVINPKDSFFPPMPGQPRNVRITLLPADAPVLALQTELGFAATVLFTTPDGGPARP